MAQNQANSLEVVARRAGFVVIAAYLEDVDRQRCVFIFAGAKKPPHAATLIEAGWNGLDTQVDK